MARKEVTITREQDNEKFFWKVYPGERHAQKGDTICLTVVGTDAVLLVPKEKLFGRQQRRDVDMPPGTLELEVKGEEGKYPYAIFCMGDPAGFAVGGSNPIIIIDPGP